MAVLPSGFPRNEEFCDRMGKVFVRTGESGVVTVGASPILEHGKLNSITNGGEF